MSTTAAPPKQPKLKLTDRDRRVLDTTFAIDSRALSVMRVLLASFLLAEALFLEWSRPRNPDGVFDFLTQYADIIIIPFALMLLLGYKTRWAVILCWLVYSMRIRGDLLSPDIEVSVGDYILTLALFWSMFMPLGRHLSLDARQEKPGPVRFLSLASAALLLQMFIIYFSAGILKEMGEWITDATAMESVLSIPEFSTPLGTWMLQFPALLSFLSVATVVVEVVGAILVILPGKSLPTRRLVVVPFFIALHLGISALMGLELFPYICIAVWLVFLPPKFWDWVWARAFKDRTPTRSMVDTNRWRALMVGVAIVIVAVSNVITWKYYPEVEGWAEGWQTMATYLVLYQQWAMFSLPSSLG